MRINFDEIIKAERISVEKARQKRLQKRLVNVLSRIRII